MSKSLKSLKKATASGGRKSALLRETEKQVKRVAAEVKRTGKLHSAATDRYITVSNRNITNTALHKAIKKIEKTNKNIRKDARQIGKTTREAKKLVKAIVSLFKPTKSATKKRPSIKPTKKSAPEKSAPKKQTSESPRKSKRRETAYELIDLPEALNNATLNGTLEDLHKNADNYDELLQPGDIWGMRIGYRASNGHFVGGYSYRSYSNFNLLINSLSMYRFATDYGDDVDATEDLEGMIRIIRFRAPGIAPTVRDSILAWSARKHVELDKRIAQSDAYAARRKAERKERNAAKKFKKEAEKEKQELQFALRRAIAENKQLREENKAKKHIPKKGGKSK